MKDVYYFSHDSNARRDPKIIALMAKYGPEGYGVYFMLIEILSEQHSYKIEKFPRMADGLAKDMGINTEKFTEILTYIIQDCELLKQDDRYIWSDSLFRRKVIQEEKRQERVEAGRRGGIKSAEVRWGKQDVSQSKHSLQANQPSLQADNQSIVKESKGKESKYLTASDQMGFDQFWVRYPANRAHGGAKNEALKAWAEMKPPYQEVLSALKWQTKSEQWVKENGQYVPTPANYLLGRRWEDRPTAIASAPVSEGKSWVDPTPEPVKRERAFFAQYLKDSACGFCGKPAHPVMGCDCQEFESGLSKAVKGAK